MSAKPMARSRGSTAVSMNLRSSGSASIRAVCGLGTRTRSTSSALHLSAVMTRRRSARCAWASTTPSKMCRRIVRYRRPRGRQRQPQPPRLRLLENVMTDGDVLRHEAGGVNENSLLRPLASGLRSRYHFVDFAVKLPAREDAVINHLAEGRHQVVH